MTKTVCVIDSSWAGSIVTFHKIFVEVFLNLGCKVVSLSPAPDTVTSHINAVQPGALNNRFRAYRIENPRAREAAAVSLFYRAACRFRIDLLTGIPPTFRSLKYWGSTARQLQLIQAESWRIDLAFFGFPDMEYMAPWLTPRVLDQVFPFKWSALYLGPIEFRMKLRLGNLLMLAHRNPELFRARNCSAVTILDEGIKNRLKDRLKGKPVITLPDFTDERLGQTPGALETLIRERAGSRVVIGLFGELSLRKGVLTFLAAARQAAAEGYDWLFVCVGSLGPKSCAPKEETAIRKAIAAAGSNCLFHLERIPDEPAYNGAISACSILYVAYWEFLHSSNTLLKAVIFGLPIIGSKGYCIEERIKRYGLGVCIDERSASQAVKAISALSRWQDLDGEPLRPDFAGYRADHSIGQLKERLGELLTCNESEFAPTRN